MAVFTTVSPEQATALAHELALGDVVELRGITAGIENTNYFLTTQRGDWVLTLFERLTREQLPFYLSLMQHLARHGIPVPDPQADASGRILHDVAGKPAAVVNRLRGQHELQPEARHCAQVGAMLARMHLAGRDFPMHQDNLRGLAWWQETAPAIAPFLTAAQSELLSAELGDQSELAGNPTFKQLPRGAVHGDLFRDNVMFEKAGGEDLLSGFFDFYFAGVDCFLFDIAVCLNDWCADIQTGILNTEHAAAFLDAYDQVRPLQAQEAALLPILMRAAALRFWISRLWDLHLPREASMLKPHDPSRFEHVLRERRTNPWQWQRR